MLTVRPPIQLKLKSSLSGANTHFRERMEGNYQLMRVSIQPEDLLHLISQPPEVYLDESGMTSLVNTANLYQNQEINLEIINNVMNRVLLSDRYSITYQDQVFISSVFRKLGVTNVQEFMSRFVSMKEETKNRQELMNLYWNHLEELRQLAVSYVTKQKEAKESEPESAKEYSNNVLSLHQKIFNRLGTGSVYEEVKNYLTASFIQNRIYPSELQVGEQTVLSQNILLNQLKNVSAGKEEPLVYNRMNVYEMGDADNRTEQRIQNVQEVNQAVLFHLLDQIYALRFGQIMERTDVWYRLEGALYQSAENTIRRYEHYHNQTNWSRQEAKHYVRTYQENQKQEISILNRIFPESEREVTNREEYWQIERTAPGQPELVREVEVSEVSHTIHHTDLEYLPQETIVQNRESELILTEETRLKRELDRINEQNIANWEKLQSMQPLEVRNHRITIDRQQARRDALRALESPEEVMMEYLTSENRLETMQREENEYLQQVISEETKQIFSELEKYRNIQEQTGIGGRQDQAQMQLERDIRFRNVLETERYFEEQEHRQEDLVYETRTDVQELLHTQEEGIRIRTEEKIRQHTFPEETVKMFARLEEQRKVPDPVVLELLSKGEEAAEEIRIHRRQESRRELETNELVKEELIHTVQEEILEPVKTAVSETLIRQEDSLRYDRIDLVHKSQEQTVQEELLEEIESRRQRNRVIEEKTEEHQVTEKIQEREIKQIFHEMKVDQQEEIARLVSQNLQQQIGRLSDQVYGKLEKRLDGERRRRGL